MTDKEVLGSEGRSYAAPRYTSRAILKDARGLYALMYSEKNQLYSLPGGGIEEGEDPITALKREVLEETGCGCSCVVELGCVLENRFCLDYTQCNYYYIVETSGPVSGIHMTKDEIDSRTSLQWHALDEVIRLVSAPVRETVQRKFLQARDSAALREYQAR